MDVRVFVILSQTTSRQINVKLCETEESKDDALERMREKIGSEQGRHIYSQCLGMVELMFGHITDAIGAEPHAGCWEGWRLETSGYPIMFT